MPFAPVIPLCGIFPEEITHRRKKHTTCTVCLEQGYLHLQNIENTPIAQY